MSYYDTSPSLGFGPMAGSTLTSGNYEAQAPLMRPTGGFRYRQVEAPETVQGQLNNLLYRPNDYITGARQRGVGQAASRGLMNSSLAAATGEGAAIEGAMPIAAQDAAWYGQTHADNMRAENDALNLKAQLESAGAIAGQQSATQTSIAQMQANLDRERMNQAQNQWEAQFGREGSQYADSQNWLERQFADSQNRYNTDWERQGQMHAWDQQDFERQNEANRQNFIGSSIMNTVFSDPSYWRDPQSALNFANTYGSNFSNLWSNLFPRNSP